MSRRVLRCVEIVDYGAPPDRIYNIMVYPDTLSDLDSDVAYWSPDELPPRVGTLNRFKLKVFGMPTFIELVSEYTVVEPPHRLVVEGVRPVWAKGRWTVDLADLPGGATRSTTSFEIDSALWAVPLAHLALALIHRGIRTGTSALLRRLGPPRSGVSQ